MKEIELELNEALFKIDVTDLFSAEKFVSKIIQHFEKRGRLNELKGYVNRIAKRPDHQLMEEFVIGNWNGSKVKVPLYEMLEEEGITFDPENFLRLDGERVAYVNDRIIPLKGKKEALKYVLNEIIELKRELSYPSEVYELPSFVDPKNGFFDMEKGRWIYPEDFIQANKAAYDLRLFWKSLDKQEVSEDPFIQTLRDINSLPEYDHEEESQQMQLAREFNRNRIKLKLLEELEKTKVYKEKKWKMVPAIKLEMNPGYEEFFHNRLGDYSTEEMHTALKELEKELTGNNKLKIRALRKEFEKKEGISKRKKRALILGGLIAGAAGCYIAYELTRDRKPPVIEHLRWEPRRIVNDKIYDVNVTFSASDDKSSIASAKLIFEPEDYSYFIIQYGMRPEDYNLVFPNDTRVIQLIPVDGVFNSTHEEFVVPIKNITGGVEYRIIPIVKDSAGNEGRAEIKTPYIREYENLGKQLYERGIKIGSIYGLITVQHTWDDYLKLGGLYKPLLGYYVVNSTEDLTVIEKHMDWMSGHGINFVLFVWSGNESKGDIRDKFYKEAISTLDIFKTGGMTFGILYESHWRFISPPGTINMSDIRNIQILKEDLSYLTENYFRHPAYLKIKGNPFFYIYFNKGMSGDVISGLEEVYKFMKKNYGIQLYMVSDHALPEVDENWRGSGGGEAPPVKDLAPLFNAMLTGIDHTPDYPRYGSYEDYLEMGYKYWYNFSLRNGLDYIPFANPGYSAKYCSWHPPELREADPGYFPRSIEMWKKRLEMSIPYSNTFGMMVGDFNNVFENGHIEPTIQEGFEYLKMMRKVLTKYYLKTE